MAIFVLCVEVFFCRILDVTLATLRTVFTVRSKILISSLLGLLETLVWFLIVKEALNTDLGGIWVAIAYAGGYAAGTALGGVIIKYLVKTTMSVQIVTSSRNPDLLGKIREAGFPMTVLDAYGQNHESEKYMILIELSSKDYKKLQAIIKEHDPSAFITTNDLKSVEGGFFMGKKK